MIRIPRRFSVILVLAVLLAAPGLAVEARGAEPIDLGKICLELATIQEPEVKTEALGAALDGLEKQARVAIKGVKGARQIVGKLNEVLLKGRSVTYISNKYWRDSTLAASALRGRGNCLSTTTLYAVLGQKLKLPIRAVLVPRHAFARWDDGVSRINIETTAGGRELPDAHYHGQTTWAMSDAKWMRHGESLATVQFAAELYRYASHHLLQTRRPEQALELIEKSKALWPENPSLEIDRLGVLYEGLGRHEKGVKGYEKLYVSHPSPEIKTRALMGMMHHLQNVSRHEDALAGLRVAYKIAPKYLQSSVLSAMSSSYRTLRRFDEALATQELATVLEGEADDYSNLAIFYKNAGKLGDAIRCLKKSLGMNPESWNTRLILAGYLYRAGKEKEGEAMFKTVEKPRVGEEFYYTNLAWFYGSIGKKKEFLEALDKALSLYKTPGILNYIKTEVDFDKFREDPAFKALVEKHRARLLSAR